MTSSLRELLTAAPEGEWFADEEKIGLDDGEFLQSLGEMSSPALAALVSLTEERKQLEEALIVYEAAVQKLLRIAPTHWQRYRDPFELGPEIQDTRRLARSLRRSLGDTPEKAEDIGGNTVARSKTERTEP